MTLQRLALVLGFVLAIPPIARAEGEPPQYCIGDYADDLSHLAPHAREAEHQAYSFCVRNTAVYECLSYASDGSVRRTRRSAVAHGTAFAYRSDNGSTLLMTNEHVAEWPQVTAATNAVDGVPAGCKRVSQTLAIVDGESDSYETDDIALTRVVSDPQLDAAILRAKAALPLLPWKIGRSASLRERNVIETRGFPLGAFAATNVGKVISAFDHDDEKDWDHDDFVIDALLSPGNSGSPVLAVSCKTGELELVGVFHAGYERGSALNVVVGVDQLRDLMTTLKRAPHTHGETVVALDAAARSTLLRRLAEEPLPFFPFGPLTAAVRPRSDGALVFEVFARDFPFHTTPLFAYEDLGRAAEFGEVGRAWFGGLAGLRAYARADLDADAQAGIARTVEALRRDALAFVLERANPLPPSASRQEFERVRRAERSLTRTVAGRREAAANLGELAERLAPHPPDPIVPVAELLTPLLPTSLAIVAKPVPPVGK
jgi:S1-C subfamily serine protease